MRLGFNIAIVCIVTVICVTALLIVAVANGHNSALITGGVAALVGIPTSILTFFITKSKYTSKE